MQKRGTTSQASQTRATTAVCCTALQCESGLKNNYFEGKRLTPGTFQLEQRYLVERRRLLNRAIHGWGVVSGYAIQSQALESGGGGRALKISSGLALDECGRELLHLDELIRSGDVIVLDEKGQPTQSPPVPSTSYGNKPAWYGREGCWLLSAHYAEQSVDAVRINDPCRCERTEWDHTCETVRFTLRRVACKECCAPWDCELDCACKTGPCCEPEPDPECGDEPPSKGRAQRRDEPHGAAVPYGGGKPQAGTASRGGAESRARRCLCEHLAGLPLPSDCEAPLREIEQPCGRVRVDLQHGIRLACVEIVAGGCDGWTFGADLEACGPRRLVKRNDVLFDLIRGCDLTRISEIGWGPWHRNDTPVAFDAFCKGMGATQPGQEKYVAQRFWIRFSRAVDPATLRPDCVVMTVTTSEVEGGWWQTQRVPIVGLDTSKYPAEPGEPADYVRGAQLVFDGAWVDDGLLGRKSWFWAGVTSIEIEVRGDFIVDCNGQTVDANAVGRSAEKIGNGTPGGTFLSTFRVAQRVPNTAAPAGATPRGTGASS